jgi:hypothetical protein
LKKKLISPLLLTILLQACGGSSPTTPDVPKEPVEYTFSLTSQITNDCGISTAFTGVELLLQDDTWQTIETYKVDESGVISFVTESEFINYTIVAKDQKGSEAEGLNVVSFYQANSATPSHYQAQFDELLDGLNDVSCECVTQDIKLSHRTFDEQTSVTSSLGDVTWSPIDSKTTLIEGIKVCKAIDGSWPLHSFSVLGTDSNNKSIIAGGLKDDFSENVDGVWLLAADEVADSVDLVMPHQAFTTNQVIGNTKHFTTKVIEEDKNLLIFDTHTYISEAYYQSQASVTFDERDSVVRSSVVKTTHQIVSTSYEESFKVKANEQRPPIDDIGITEIKSDGSYDYSAIVGFPMAVISYTFLTFDPETQLLMPAKWTFYGPEQGTLAISAPLEGYVKIIDINTRKEAINVRLVKSMSTNNYQDYVKYYQGVRDVDMSNDFVKNIDEVLLNVAY